MKKIIIGLALLFPIQLLAADDSVYSWGAWTQGIMPAAGNITPTTPAPAQKPNVNFRPNESAKLSRHVQVALVTPTPAAIPTPTVAPAVRPDAPQLPDVVIVTDGNFAGSDQL